MTIPTPVQAVPAQRGAPLPRAASGGGVLAARTRALLGAGVPLSLLLDLADPDGPSSAELYQDEGGCARWLQGA